MITIKDIAKKLGVSYSTVSRCLNNDPTVSEKTREKVITEARKVGFSFNVNARNLVKKETNRIGLILSNNFNQIDNRWFFNEISGHCIISIERNKYDFIIQPNENIYHESNVFKLIRGQMVDGLVIASKNVSKEEYEFLVNSNIPHVFIYFKPLFLKEIPDNLFYDDNEYGGYIATRHMIEKGHNKILTITSNDENLRMYHERTSGYLRAMEEYGLDSCIIECDHMNFEYQEEYLKKHYDTIINHTAVFAQQDLVALGMIKSLEKHYGVNVPQDISFVGYNNIDLIRYFDVPLTTVEDPRSEVIGNAVDYLIDRIKDSAVKPINNKLYPSLIARGTVK